MTLPKTTDFLVIGGGVVGVAIARQLTSRHPGMSVTLIEKEDDCGLHASGRNSGVLHAGFYYTADSLKARFTRDGNRQLRDYCTARGLRLNACGKLVVTTTEEELAGLDELILRGRANGVELSEVSVKEAAELEPMARTVERALWSPTTAVVDPSEVLQSLVRDIQSAGVRVVTSTAYLGNTGDTVQTSCGSISAGYVVNAAGLYADKVARSFGFSEHFRILPFKGLYLYGDGGFRLRCHVYPVPNLASPFLGVHFTVTVNNVVKIGPTAVPALWRENYKRLSRFRPLEFADIAWREAKLFATNAFGFRSLALQEVRKYRRTSLVRMASALAPSVKPQDFRQWGKAGIRAQLFDLRTQKLEMDFRYEGDRRSFHVLNAVSPAFTCSLPFAEHVVGEIDKLIA